MELLRQLFLWTSQNSNSLYSVPRPRTLNRAEILGEDLIYVRNSTITGSNVLRSQKSSLRFSCEIYSAVEHASY